MKSTTRSLLYCAMVSATVLVLTSESFGQMVVITANVKDLEGRILSSVPGPGVSPDDDDVIARVYLLTGDAAGPLTRSQLSVGRPPVGPPILSQRTVNGSTTLTVPLPVIRTGVDAMLVVTFERQKQVGRVTAICPFLALPRNPAATLTNSIDVTVPERKKLCCSPYPPCSGYHRRSRCR